MKKHLLILAAAIAAAVTPAAHADTFLQFLTTSSNVSFDGTTLSGSATVDLTYLNPIAGAPSTATFTFSATAVQGSAGSFFGDDFENFTNISFSILNGPTNILSGTAATGYILGGGAGFDLDASEPTDTIAFTSSLYGPMTDLSIQISTGPPSTLGITNDNIDAFTTTAGPSAFVGTPASVTPEPSSLLLLGTGLVGLAGTARRRFKA